MNISEMHRAFKLELDKTSALELPAFEPEEIDYWLNNGIRRFAKTRYTGSSNGVGFEQTTKRMADLSTLLKYEDLSVITDSSRPNSYVADLNSLSYPMWFIVGEEASIVYHDIRDVASENKLKRQGITQCTLDTYRSHIDDPYSEHRLHYEEAKPLRLFYNNTAELVTDGNYVVLYYHVRYLKKPERINNVEVSYTALNGNVIESGLTYLVTNDAISYNGVTYEINDTFMGISNVSNFEGAGTVTTLIANCDLPEHTHDEIVKLAVSMALENIEQPRYQTYQNELKNVE